LNFTFEKMDRLKHKLDAFKNIVKDLERTESIESSDKAERLVGEIITGFEENMNNDLDVKAAFDSLLDIVSELNILMKQNKLSSDDAHNALANLRRIDQVLWIIF